MVQQSDNIAEDLLFKDTILHSLHRVTFIEKMIGWQGYNGLGYIRIQIRP